MADIIADEFARYPAWMRPVKAGEDHPYEDHIWSMDSAGEENARRAKLRETWIDPRGSLVTEPLVPSGPPRTIERSPEMQAAIDKMASDEQAAADRFYTAAQMSDTSYLLEDSMLLKNLPSMPRVRRLTLTAQDSGYLVNTGASEAGSATYHAFTTLDEAVEFMRGRIA